MKIKETRDGKTINLTNEDVTGYDVWRNIGSFDSRTGRAKYFNGKWFKDITEEDGKHIRIFEDKTTALKAILSLYSAAKFASDKAKEGVDE